MIRKTSELINRIDEGIDNGINQIFLTLDWAKEWPIFKNKRVNALGVVAVAGLGIASLTNVIANNQRNVTAAEQRTAGAVTSTVQDETAVGNDYDNMSRIALVVGSIGSIAWATGASAVGIAEATRNRRHEFVDFPPIEPIE